MKPCTIVNLHQKKTQFMPFVKFQLKKNSDAGDIEGLNAAVKEQGA